MAHPSSHLAALIAALGLAAATPAVAKDKAPPPRPAQIDALFGCRAIADPTERLACFDREVTGLAAADANRDITFADKATMKETRRGLFGFHLPALGGIFGGDEDQIKEIETTIRSVSVDRSGKYTLVMDDDAVWTQIDTASLGRDPKPGQKVKIKAASMGSYFATVNGGRMIRMKRDR